jgi:hypothetical protein
MSAFSRGSVPHVRHAAMAVIRPSADPGPQRFQGPLRIGRWTLTNISAPSSPTMCSGRLPR